jgi:hypothetical protein
MFDFLSTKKTIEATSTQFRNLAIELRKTEAEIAATVNAPTNRKDICELAEKWVEKSKAGFGPALAYRLRNSFSHGETSSYEFGFFAAIETQSEGLTSRAMDEAMCSVFGTEIKAAIVDAINKMDWPDEGLARVERAAKVDKLRTHEKDIRAELAALQKNADEAGFEIQG